MEGESLQTGHLKAASRSPPIKERKEYLQKKIGYSEEKQLEWFSCTLEQEKVRQLQYTCMTITKLIF